MAANKDDLDFDSWDIQDVAHWLICLDRGVFCPYVPEFVKNKYDGAKLKKHSKAGGKAFEKIGVKAGLAKVLAGEVNDQARGAICPFKPGRTFAVSRCRARMADCNGCYYEIQDNSELPVYHRYSEDGTLLTIQWTDQGKTGPRWSLSKGGVEAFFKKTKKQDRPPKAGWESVTDKSQISCDLVYLGAYSVIAAKGVTVRAGRQTNTSKVGKFPRGRAVHVSDIIERRVRIVRPCSGWTSIRNAKGDDLLTPNNKVLEADIKKFWDELDTDGGGTIDISELTAALRGNLPAAQQTKEYLEVIFDAIDIDGDGTISWEEFNTRIQRTLKEYPQLLDISDVFLTYCTDLYEKQEAISRANKKKVDDSEEMARLEKEELEKAAQAIKEEEGEKAEDAARKKREELAAMEAQKQGVQARKDEEAEKKKEKLRIEGERTKKAEAKAKKEKEEEEASKKAAEETRQKDEAAAEEAKKDRQLRAKEEQDVKDKVKEEAAKSEEELEKNAADEENRKVEEAVERMEEEQQKLDDEEGEKNAERIREEEAIKAEDEKEKRKVAKAEEEQEKKDLKILKSIDKDGNGQLDREEIQKAKDAGVSPTMLAKIEEMVAAAESGKAEGIKLEAMNQKVAADKAAAIADEEGKKAADEAARDDETRLQWKVRSYVEVYSSSKKTWFAGQITQIRGEKISIRYYAGGWRDKNVKRASRTAVRPLKSKESLTALTERIAEAREAKAAQAQQEKVEREKELALVKKKAEEAGKLEAERLKKKAQKSGIEQGDPVRFTYKGIVQTGTVKAISGGSATIKLTKKAADGKAEISMKPAKLEKITQEELKAGGEKPKEVQESVTREYTTRITDLYQKHNPRMVSLLNTLLTNKYFGQEHKFYIKICNKYNETPKPEFTGKNDTTADGPSKADKLKGIWGSVKAPTDNPLSPDADAMLEKAFAMARPEDAVRTIMADFREVFDDFDVDGDGEIKAVEFITGMRDRLGRSMPQKNLFQIFRTIDVDESGEITWDEFSSRVRATLERHQHLSSIGEVLSRMFQDIIRNSTKSGAVIKMAGTAAGISSNLIGGDEAVTPEEYQNKIVEIKRELDQLRWVGDKIDIRLATNKANEIERLQALLNQHPDAANVDKLYVGCRIEVTRPDDAYGGQYHNRKGTIQRYLAKKEKWGVVMDDGKKFAIKEKSISKLKSFDVCVGRRVRVTQRNDDRGGQFFGKVGTVEKFLKEKQKWGIRFDGRAPDGSIRKFAIEADYLEAAEDAGYKTGMKVHVADDDGTWITNGKVTAETRDGGIKVQYGAGGSQTKIIPKSDLPVWVRPGG